MNKTEKAKMIEDLHEVFGGAAAIVVTHYTGLTVAELGDLRREMRKVGARFRVTKNRLAQRALSDTAYGPLGKLFKGPTAVAYSDDPVAAAKAVTAFAKRNEKLVVLGGAMGSTVLDPNGVKALATLPSLDELRGKIVGLLNAPATKIAGILQAPAGQLARVVAAHAREGASTQG